MKPFLNERLTCALKAAERVFLCTHIAPDGDAIGSLLAAKLLLEGMGKSAVACCADPVPGQYLPLPGAAEILKPDQLTGGFDAALSLDAADLQRLGACARIYEHAPVRLQIDHHGTNPGFADENEVDAEAPAAGVIVARLFKAMGQPLTAGAAECLYAAISTDTGNFSFPSVNAETFEVMAEVVKTGFDLGFWARQLHLMREREYLGMLSRALSRLTFLYDGKVSVTTVLPGDYADTGARLEHSDNIVNYGMYIPGVCVSCFVNSPEDGLTKFSFRALQPYSAQRIAVRLGGGGHEAAAGATLKLPREQAVAAAMEAIGEEMSRHS